MYGVYVVIDLWYDCINFVYTVSVIELDDFCPLPSNPPNGRVIEEPLSSNLSTALRKAKYICNEGYNLSVDVDATMECDSSGHFNPTTQHPVCVELSEYFNIIATTKGCIRLITEGRKRLYNY